MFPGCRGFLHHSCPEPDVVLTHWQTSFQKPQEDWSSPQGSRRAHKLYQQLQTSTIGSPHNMDKPSTSWTVWYWPLLFVMLEILTSSSYNAKRLSTFKNVIFSPYKVTHIKYVHYSLIILIWMTLKYFMLPYTDTSYMDDKSLWLSVKAGRLSVPALSAITKQIYASFSATAAASQSHDVMMTLHLNFTATN